VLRESHVHDAVGTDCVCAGPRLVIEAAIEISSRIARYFAGLPSTRSPPVGGSKVSTPNSR
jgi:hypothetical protein